MASEIMNRVNEQALRKHFVEACADATFKKVLKKLDVSDTVAMRYTSQIQESVCELKNCAKCPGLIYCKNRLDGHALYPQKSNNQIIFSYRECKYETERKNKEANRMTRDKELASASMKDIDLTDAKRAKVLKWLKNFCDTYDISGSYKGLYLHGPFGCGKTFLIAAVFNELAKKRISTEIIYYPQLLVDLKSDFDTFGDRLDYLKNVDLLLLDDIGAEKVSEWSRDEILGTILQYRMNNYKTTFFTSNLNLEELEEHLIINSSIDERIKAKRIVERVKQLTIETEMLGENKRK